MPEPSLRQLERQVEDARAKLTGDLSILRAPATATEFTEGLKQEAVEAKDAILNRAKSSVQSSVDALLEDLKARAAANPAAALAIGAGIAWRLITHPPVATTLVGAGLFSLFRTQPARIHSGAAQDYLAQAKDRLREQATEAVSATMAKAAAIGETMSEEVTEFAVETAHKAERLMGEAASVASDATTATQERAGKMWNETVGRAANDAEARDTLLLGAAGIAVAAAIGIACQRRVADPN